MIVICVLAALTGLVRPSDMGLRGALIADTMPPEQLAGAMGMSRTTSDTARIAGALTGAGLFAAFGIGPAYVVITAFYSLSALLTWYAVDARRRRGRGGCRPGGDRQPRRGATCARASC